MHSLPLKNRFVRLVGTHQKLDRVARRYLNKFLEPNVYFPSGKEIVYFEGMRGPDGLKRKCPNDPQPSHFLLPDADDKILLSQVLDCRENLKNALKENNRERAAFEAAWLAHYLTDALTPAHHFPLHDVRDELMSDNEYFEIFGRPLRYVMRGDSPKETVKNNWSYYGKGGAMTKHFFFEFKVAQIINPMKSKNLFPRLSKKDLENVDLEKEVYKSVNKIHKLKMYDRYRELGWTEKLNVETKKILLPEIIKLITLAWYSSLPEEKSEEK